MGYSIERAVPVTERFQLLALSIEGGGGRMRYLG
jgi:hypothetical protein